MLLHLTAVSAIDPQLVPSHGDKQSIETLFFPSRADTLIENSQLLLWWTSANYQVALSDRTTLP